MNYEKHYNLLIDRARNRTINGYKEKHHIVPKCMNGTDYEDNLVWLTADEHFVAHQLLVKMYPTNKELIYAANMMCVFDKDQAERSRNKQFKWLKERRSKIMSELFSGEGNPRYDVPISEETRNKLRGRIPHNKGIPQSQEQKDKQSAKMKGRPSHNKGKKGPPCSDEQKIRVSNKLKGIPKSEEHKRKVSEGQKRRHALRKGI